MVFLILLLVTLVVPLPGVNISKVAEYEDEFREAMIEAGLPVDKGLDETAEEGEKE